jgi:hypothetical protein
MMPIRPNSDAHSFRCPGSVLEIQIGSRSMEINQKLQNKPGLLSFKKSFSNFLVMSFDLDPDPHGDKKLDPDPH